MRFATIRHGDTLTGARVEGDRVVLVDADNAVDAFLRQDRLCDTGEVDAATAHYARVSPNPAHILCVGLNYRSHIEQLGRPAPRYPTFFAKFPSTLTGPRDRIVLPAVSDRVEGEVELAVVIGRPLHRATPTEAAAAMAGFTVANDLSLRDWQHRTTEALQGKVFDRSTPLGPVLVTPDEVDDARDLALSFSVDGVPWQRGSTSDLLFSPAELVAYCSNFLTLRPGDVILTGTPGGTAEAASLVPGQTMTTFIEGIGTAVNPADRDPFPDTRHAWEEEEGSQG
ncbi:fumarylacetoacetate hydrolase family protein [Streptomyces sp. NPDC127072]|uniref:fumarylacetoacetate hydrolase family protein n=1 Tax=Streptomyces sp. NPDC127072 TaxID=3347129 RepID=UPI00365B1BB8